MLGKTYIVWLVMCGAWCVRGEVSGGSLRSDSHRGMERSQLAAQPAPGRALPASAGASRGGGAHVREKRAKYYSIPPPGARSHKRPPPYRLERPVKGGVFSYTPPPPDYSSDSDEGGRGGQPFLHSGLADTFTHAQPKPSPAVPSPPLDQDINNFINSVSKEDLDMLLELVKDRQKPDVKSPTYQPSLKYKHSDNYQSTQGSYDIEFNNSPKQEIYHGLFATSNVDQKSQQNLVYQTQPSYNSGPYVSDINNELHDMISQSDGDDAGLPKPENLRAEPDVSFSKYQPSYARPTTGSAAPARPASYKPESVKDLPLSEYSYRSRPKQVNSYSVPHYSVTSESPPGRSGPAAAAAAGESALKAVAIWTHKSRGAAYTLHEDGTLSVEPG